MKKILQLILAIYISFDVHAQTAASYAFNASTETFNSIQGFGTAATTNGDDLFDTNIPIGFTFGYCGATYSQLYASSNGYISLPNVLPSSGAPSASNNANSVQMLASGTGLICPFWDDLDGTGRSSFYATLGNEPNRVFVFEWVEFGLYGGLKGATADTLNFQVKLYETSGTIQFCYGPHNQPALTATIGIFNSTSDYQTLDAPSASPTPSSTNLITNINSLPADGQVYTWSLGPLAIKNNEPFAVKTFPNPTHGSINLVASTNIESVVIFNMTGQQIAALTPMSNQFAYTFDTGGCYYLQVVSEVKSETIRVIVE